MIRLHSAKKERTDRSRKKLAIYDGILKDALDQSGESDDVQNPRKDFKVNTFPTDLLKNFKVLLLCSSKHHLQFIDPFLRLFSMANPILSKR